MKAKVFVTFKEGVLDPQGKTIKSAIDSLGYKGVEDVRQGKYFELTLDNLPKEKAEKLVKEIAEKILTNPIIEQFRYHIE
ncbi:MAG: phosphoribosylformylglycinamidine synthase subunit PurS [Candidatus Aminicenantes bacterium]|nr:phosphoribosylformylglycinamidine synthase subunit PurS [Candidatus Aminicenantes bacterium]MDH5715789.1 phosphoribosylformylglycinamidine synthase subunit PurS [Candidatus Aminicenantes bacterium]